MNNCGTCGVEIKPLKVYCSTVCYRKSNTFKTRGTATFTPKDRSKRKDV